MKKQLLITYATWSGSTRDIAIHMAECLQKQEELKVDIQPVKIVKDLSPYQAVIIGTPIRAGAMHPQITRWIKQQQKALTNLPTAFYINCLTMKEDCTENRAVVQGYLQKMLRKVPGYQPAIVEFFGGALYPEKLPYLFRKMFENSPDVQPGDYRDWGYIERWSQAAAEQLLAL